MEVQTHESRADLWDDAFELAFRILHEWFDADLLDKADVVADQFEEITEESVGKAFQWRERLEAEHLTKEQQRYADRCYPKAPVQANQALPWPAPERVEDESIQILASIVREESTTSPKAWAAVRVLGVAAVIEAARRADEVSRDAGG